MRIYLGMATLLLLAACTATPVATPSSAPTAAQLGLVVIEQGACQPKAPMVRPSDWPADQPLPAAYPGPSRQELQELFERNQAANKAFRDRRELSAAQVGANSECAEAVGRALDGLWRLKAHTVDDVRQTLTPTGLMDITVRPPGRLDASSGAGLLFGGWTGSACIVGTFGPASVTVVIVAPLADGGCLPAPG